MAARVPRARANDRVRVPACRDQLPGAVRQPPTSERPEPPGGGALPVGRPRRPGLDPGHGPEPGRGAGGRHRRRHRRTRRCARRRRRGGRAPVVVVEAGSGPVSNLADVLLAPAQRTPDAVALRAGPDTVTYRELESRAARVAGALRAEGVQPGDQVTIEGHNTIAFVTSYLGDRKSTRLNSSHMSISYAVFCLKKKKMENNKQTLNDKTHRQMRDT